MQTELFIIAALSSLTCAMLGPVILLRRISLMSDAVSHSVLLGIVVAALLSQSTEWYFLLPAAALVGMLLLYVVQWLQRKSAIESGAALGLIFPFFFSLAVILIHQFGRNLHLDEHLALMGEMAFAPFERLVLAGRDVGPVSVYTMSTMIVLQFLFLIFNYRKLKHFLFDREHYELSGHKSKHMDLALQAILVINALVVFRSIGIIVFIALLVAPAASALLFSRSLIFSLLLAQVLALGAGLGGARLALLLDWNFAGSICLVLSIIFLLSFLFNPAQGLIAAIKKRKQQLLERDLYYLLLHLKTHQGRTAETSLAHMQGHFSWTEKHANQVLERGRSEAYLDVWQDQILLSEAGEARVSG